MIRTASLSLLLLATAPAHAQESALLSRSNERDWTLTVTVNLRSYQDIDPRRRVGPEIDYWSFDTAAVVFPLLSDTASSRLNVAELDSRLTFNDRVVDTAPDFLRNYHSGATLGKWELVDKKGRECELQVKLPITCWNTAFDEAAAMRVAWPKGEWPAVAKSTFEPQMYIDLAPDGQPIDMQPVRRLLDNLTNKKDPKSIPPAQLAKFLAGEVQRFCQFSGNGLGYNRQGSVEGIDLKGAVAVVNDRGRGSEFDAVCLLVALYRQAGLPARIVIGYDISDRIDDDTFLDRKGKAKIAAWAEFFLLDEPTQTGVWVPVDLARMRKSSSRPPPLDRPWKYFGTHDELSGMIPFAFHFHPPTTVLSYGTPGFWGWLVTPAAPERAFQSISFSAITTPKTAETERRRREERRQ